MAVQAKVIPVRGRWTALLIYVMTAVIALAAACVVMKVWGADLTVPFSLVSLIQGGSLVSTSTDPLVLLQGEVSALLIGHGREFTAEIFCHGSHSS